MWWLDLHNYSGAYRLCKPTLLGRIHHTSHFDRPLDFLILWNFLQGKNRWLVGIFYRFPPNLTFLRKIGNRCTSVFLPKYLLYGIMEAGTEAVASTEVEGDAVWVSSTTSVATPSECTIVTEYVVHPVKKANGSSRKYFSTNNFFIMSNPLVRFILNPQNPYVIR